MFQKRIDKLRKKMREKGLDGVLLIGDPNRNYMSGFTGDESFVIISLDKAVFITDSRYIEQAINQVKGYSIREYKGRIEDYLRDLVKELGIKTLGFEENILTYKSYSTYKEK
ncbi:Xaa-Pro aminopeptidase [Clostridium tetanomorphum]|nr:Xaa-Pro aminopeptidase [Clostridium tetanomorphum]